MFKWDRKACQILWFEQKHIEDFNLHRVIRDFLNLKAIKIIF